MKTRLQIRQNFRSILWAELSTANDKMLEGREFQLLTASLAIVGVFVLLRWMKWNGTKDNGKRHPPSLPFLRLLGVLRGGGMTALPEHFRRSAEELGPVFCIKVGGRMAVVINGYEALVNSLVKQSEVFSDRAPLWIETELLNPELRGIVFARYDDLFKKYHKLSLSILKDFGYGQDRVSETRILQEVEKLNEEILKQNGRPFDPKWPFTFATAEVIISILFGNSFQKSLPDERSTLVKCSIECVSNMDLTLNMAPFVRFLPAFRRKVDVLRSTSERLLKAIDAGIEFIKSSNSEATFVGRFLEIEGTEYDHQDMVYVIRDLCFAGSETVSTTLLWAVVELANHPQIQHRLQKEIDGIVPEDRLPSLDDKPYMPYTEAVILEVMRRRTMGPFYVPHATKKATTFLDYDLPEGCIVVPNCYGVHMDPKYWGDPMNFRPERFLDSENRITNTEKMIAFGLGKRSCLGEILARQNAFLFVTSLVQRFDIRPPEGQDSIEVKEVTATTMYPTHFEVRLIPRVKKTQG